MSNKSAASLPRIRIWMKPLSRFPFHPQWLVLRERKRSERAIGALAHGRVLDIGCGNRWAESVLRADASYFGLDYPTTINLGYRGGADVFGDAAQLPFPDRSFDTVLMLDVLEHISDPELAVLEAQRVLAESGAIIVQTPFMYPLHDEPYDFQRWTHNGLRSLFERNHIKVQKVEYHGQPLETAAALLSITLAKSMIDAFGNKSAAVLLLPFVGVAIPVINVMGWLFSAILPRSGFMPLGYRITGCRCD